jgi:zinc transporter ZupT
MPVLYAVTALVGAVVMPLLTRSEDILLILALAVIGAIMAPLGAALWVFITTGDLDSQEDLFIIEDAAETLPFAGCAGCAVALCLGNS